MRKGQEVVVVYLGIWLGAPQPMIVIVVGVGREK